MSEPYPSRLLDRYVLRMPDGLRSRIATLAKANSRSMNAEIVLALEQWVGSHERYKQGTEDETARQMVSLADLLGRIARDNPGLKVALEGRLPRDDDPKASQ